MADIKNIGIITSGGDCGGLNAVVRSAAKTAESLGVGAYVIPNGYAGLYNLIEMDKLARLGDSRVDAVNPAMAGSEAGHSRVKISKIKDDNKYDRIKKGLAKFNIGGLVISGGDDTGSVVVDLGDNGIPCVHAPKTMDLDLQTYSVGGDSAINRISRFVQDIKTTGQTHNRIMVVEVFGRYAGHTAFRGGIGANADCILIPEVPTNFDSVYKHMKSLFTRRIIESDVNAGTYTIVVAEGLTDASGAEIVDESAGVDSFGHKKLAGAGKYVRDQLSKRLKADPEIKQFMKEQGMFVEGLYETPEVREVTPGHLIRSGFSSAYDVSFGLEAGASAVRLLLKGITGVTVVNIVDGNITYMPTKQAIAQRHVDLKMVSFFESLGINFGREPKPFNPEFIEKKDTVQRIF
ncbi:MAG: 6-phosphofructokinase [Spirochaetales bacterium]|nr:6-phosphofructokinase [Spirochaetales bacterium]